jgi:hypothetical protein
MRLRSKVTSHLHLRRGIIAPDPFRWRANRERSIMIKFFQTTRIASLVFGSAALALISVSPVTPAAAQGVPAGLLRLDSSQAASNDDVKLTDAQQAKVRGAYAHVRKHTAPAQ